jgi:long-chain fatty acid transport protein
MNLHARPVAELGQAFARERSAPSEQKPGWRHLATGVLAAAFVAAGTAPAHAGGLYISEYGTPSMGTADAGSQAWGNDASAALHNPASMTRLDGHAMLAGVGAGITQVEFDPDRAAIEGDDGGNAGTVAPLSTISGVARLSERWRAGLSVGGITGAALDYNRNWVGRFQVTDVSLLVAGVTPSVAVKVTDWLSLGAAATLWYARLNQKIRPSAEGGDGRIKIDDADDTETTFNLSAMIELSEATRFGVVYNSEANLNLSGDVDVEPLGLAANVGLDFTFPQWVKAGVYHDLTDRIALLGSVRWEDWSAFDEIPVSVDRGDAAIPANWRDTYGFSLGLHYRATDRLLLQTGIGYDTSPVSDANRRAELPIDRQYRVSFGMQYDWSERLRFGGSILYADLGDADIDANLFGGSYDKNRALFLAANLAYRF